MKYIMVMTLLLSASFAHSDEVFRIQVGRDYKGYTTEDLQKRVWELERAVNQLQLRVFKLELTNTAPVAPIAPAADTWSCTIEAKGDTHMGTGPTKAVANAKALEACKKANGGDGFFCNPPKCSQ